MFYKKKLGAFGEKAAISYLKKQKYNILKQNFSAKGFEVDIIAKKDDYYVFVEVKTRTSEEYGHAAEAVGYNKQQKIKQGAYFYLGDKLNDSFISFDIIEVYVKNLGNKMIVLNINHIKSAF